MFGALKKIFSKSAPTATVEQVAPRVPARPAFAPTPPSAPAAAPASATIYERPAAAGPAGAQAQSARDMISIPLTAIVQKFPGSLTTLAIKTAGVNFALPAGTALEQLPSGKVRVPFGQVRKQVPFGTFADNETHDEVIVDLPLSPILAGMSPTLLARRAQKRIEVPDDVAGVFGPKGTISSRVAQDVKTASAAPNPVAPPMPPAPASVPVAPVRPAAPVAAPIAPNPISPTPTPVFTRAAAAAPAAAPASVAPVIPVAAPVAAAAVKSTGPMRVKIAVKPAAPEAAAVAPAPVEAPVPVISAARPVTPVTPIAPVAPAAGSLPFARRAEAAAAPAAPTRLPSMGVKPAVPSAKPTIPAAPSTKAAPVVTTTEGDIVPIPLSDISDGFPDPVRQEIARGEWDLAMVNFPASRLEPGMKAGRLTFTWGEVRAWLNPPIGSVPSPHIDVPVELPLKVVAPLFLGARRVAGQRKMQIDETIPDVFTGLKAGAAQAKPAAAHGHVPAAPEEEVETAAEEAPVAPAPIAPAPPVSHVPRPDVLGTIFGQPLKSEWSPAEIAQKISDMNGVSGCVLTLADGLLVAGKVAEPQHAEIVAAFVPQVFSRLNQYAGEMQLGSLTSVTLNTPDGLCGAYKAGRMYLGVVSRAGQPLPEAQLQRIAAEIAKRNP